MISNRANDFNSIWDMVGLPCVSKTVQIDKNHRNKYDDDGSHGDDGDHNEMM